MSHDPVVSDPAAPSRPDVVGTSPALAALHPRLQAQLEQTSLASGPDWPRLLELISVYYEQLDAERRGVVRSMQLLADESRTFGEGLAGADAGHLRAILHHIKDVVITVAADGTIKLFNPIGERLFGYSNAELMGRSIAHLLPDLLQEGSVERGLAALAARTAQGDPSVHPGELSARHKDGHRFPAELLASRVRIDRRDVYVLCLRDTSDRVRAEQALRDSEARYRTLVESAPEMIVVIDRQSGRYLDANENALRFFDVSRVGLLGSAAAVTATDAVLDGNSGFAENGETTLLPNVVAPLAEAAPADSLAACLARDLRARAPSDKIQVFEWLHRDATGRDVAVEVRLMGLTGAPQLLRASLTDIAARRRAEKLTAGERDVFERIAADAPLSEVAAAIATLLESLDSTYTVAIAFVDESAQCFTEVIGSRLPAHWLELEKGLLIDMRNGSAPAAVYLGRPVLVNDIVSDPYWQRRGELALELGFRSAWAMPIKAAQGRVLGAVTIYRGVAGGPEPHELHWLGHAAQLAGIAIERHQAEAAQRASELKFRNLYERVFDGVYQCDRDGRLLEVNPAFVKMLGFANAAELYALPSIAALYSEPAQRAELERSLQTLGVVHNAEVVLTCRDGTRLVVLESARLSSDGDGRVVGYEGTLTDISARKTAEQAMFAEKERALVTLQSIGDAVITTDKAGLIDYMNPVAERLTGWHSATARGERLGAVLRLQNEVNDGEMEQSLSRCLREGQAVHTAEHALFNRQGQEIAIQDSIAAIRDRDGQIVGAVVVFRDVTKERRLRRALSYQASHDALTGLINRRELDNRLADALRSAQEQQGPHALLYMDLDQFKLVNDVCGHSAGDRLLRDITGVLQAHVRTGDTIARLGGDEFGILMPRCTAEQAARVAESMRRGIQEYRFSWDQHTTRIGVSIGVVEINADSHNVATLLSAADIACYTAKDAGRNRVHLYDARQDAARQRDLFWVGRVTRALEQDRLELFCQPIVPVGSSRRAPPPLYELFVRLRDDDGELVLPRHFIPAAERYNVVSGIDRWALQSSVQLLRELASAAEGRHDGSQAVALLTGNPPSAASASVPGTAPGPAAALLPSTPSYLLAINLSGASLGDRSFLEFALGQLNTPELASRVCFEVTEAAVLGNLSEALEFMRELRQRGCRFALADFGTDLSSFRYLKTLPIDYLKLDGECIGGLLTDPVDRCMVEAISRAARALGIATVAEKVESAAIFAELQRLGVELAQGLFIAPPEPVALLLTQGPGHGAYCIPTGTPGAPPDAAADLHPSYRAIAGARPGQHS